ncbi:FAD-binding domain-containing protein [Candidatus Accumulibacter sp. ACC012]|uniref:FAD-binding domain-containing protein n=1 Tax=Candidatus Accumulibacter sp. ACC012 TaxID=2823332 RepID=UPI003435E632
MRLIFAAQLNDFDLAANNGGWQWAASSGCDAQPISGSSIQCCSRSALTPPASSFAATCRNWLPSPTASSTRHGG